ncbi:MAG TPA: stalk domain-containing protein [Clostridia bacterium]|nr:stalk domain-containing protein [Clostridia bacterium]
MKKYLSFLLSIAIIWMVCFIPADFILVHADSKYNWTKVLKQAAMFNLNSVAWVGDQYVAVGNEYTIVTSKDGIEWKQRYEQLDIDLKSVCGNGKIMVAVGDSGMITTSYDGVKWTEQRSGCHNDLKNVVWNGKEFLASGDSITCKSSDGLNWSKFAAKNHNYTIWDGKKYISVGPNGSIYTSKDGISWINTKGPSAKEIKSLAYNSKTYAMLETPNLIITSPDLTKWAKRVSSFAGQLNSITWDGSMFFIAGDSGVIETSTDGVKWTKQSTGTTNNLLCIASNGKSSVAVGNAGTIVYGTKGKNILAGSVPKASDMDLLSRFSSSVVMKVNCRFVYKENMIVDELIEKVYSKKISNNKVIFVPASTVCSYIGADYKYDRIKKSFYINYGNKTLVSKIGTESAVLNGKTIRLAAPSIIEGDTVFVPLNSVFSDALGKQVFFDRGLIIISDITNILDKDKDKLIIDTLLKIITEEVEIDTEGDLLTPRLARSIWWNKLFPAMDAKDYVKAINCSDIILSLKMNSKETEDAYIQKAIALYELKKYEESVKICDEAIKAKWGESGLDAGTFYYLKSQALVKLGKQDEAIDALRIAISIEPVYKGVVKTDKEFDEIRDNQDFINLLK